MGTRGVWPPIGSLNTNRWLVQDSGYVITMESEAYNYTVQLSRHAEAKARNIA